MVSRGFKLGGRHRQCDFGQNPIILVHEIAILITPACVPNYRKPLQKRNFNGLTNVTNSTIAAIDQG